MESYGNTKYNFPNIKETLYVEMCGIFKRVDLIIRYVDYLNSYALQISIKEKFQLSNKTSKIKA